MAAIMRERRGGPRTGVRRETEEEVAWEGWWVGKGDVGTVM